MNIKLLCTLPIGLLVVGCAAYTPPSAPPGAPVCKAYSDLKSLNDCKGKPNAPHVTLSTKTLGANPACIRVYPGKTIVFKLEPAASKVEIFPKKRANKWLAGTNDSNEDYIFIKVPKNIEFPENKKQIDFDYGIKIGTDCVDPRVRVEMPGGPG